MLNNLLSDLKSLADLQKAKVLQRFFKTGKGEYGEGDIFFGIMVPELRKLAKKYKDLPISDVHKLLISAIHEHRLTGLFILIWQYSKSDEKKKKEIFDFYLKHRAGVSNWDLVDLSCYKIIGDFLLDKDRSVLYELAKSESLWDRRIAIVSTFAFIDRNDFSDTLNLAEILVSDKHDLIHKAVGWALREIGKKDQAAEEFFLKKHYKTMPRTMLRYAIERFEPVKRAFYMEK